MGKEDMPEDIGAKYPLENDFTEADLLDEGYRQPFRAVVTPMVEHCKQLLQQIENPDFDGCDLLDCTANGAENFIDDFFTTVSYYDEGRVPFEDANDLVALTAQLIKAEIKRWPHLREEIIKMRQAFCHSHSLWRRRRQMPTMQRKTFYKKIFKARDSIINAISDFSRKIGSPPPPQNPPKEAVVEKTQAKQRKRNGLKGPKTKMMLKQRHIFDDFLKKQSADGKLTRVSLAHVCWIRHPEWDMAKTAIGDAKGYSDYRSLAR